MRAKVARWRKHTFIRRFAHELLQLFLLFPADERIHFFRGHRLPREWRRLGRERLRWRRGLTGYLALGYPTFFDGPERLSGLPLEHIKKSGFAGLRDDVDGLAVVLHRQQLRRGRIVVVPQIMMDDLEMPQPLARSCVEGEQAVAEQVVASPIAAVKIVCRRAGWHKHDAIFFVERQVAPRVRAACVPECIFW